MHSLVETRKLPAALIDRLHERGLVYADSMQNAVFVRHVTYSTDAHWQRGEAIGASLRGTWGDNNSFHGLASGSSREQGWFWVGRGKGEFKWVMLVESPIDALSLATLDSQNRQAVDGVTIYLSTDGTGTIPIESLKQVLERGGQVAVAFDADQAGELMAWRVAHALPGVRRVIPAYGKDWNERLIWDGQPEQATQPESDKQMVRALWKWHWVAQALGRSERYLCRITEVARDVAKGNELSNQAKVAMQQDMERFIEQQRHVKIAITPSEVMRGKAQTKGDIEIGE